MTKALPRHKSAQCAKCGSTFTPMSATNRYCSSSCQQMRRRERTERTCPVCLRRFCPAGYHQVHCSMECAAKAPHIGKVCAIAIHRCTCGEWYLKRLGRWHCVTVVDSSQDWRIRWAGLKPGAHVIPTSRVCQRCGEAFIGKGLSAFCSAKCRSRQERTRQRDRRRAMQRLAFVEPVHRLRVYERDGWVCQICRGPVPMSRVVPHPKAATLDHIVPLAAGGRHAYSNVQLAHFMCNSRKSAGPAQLRWDISA